MRLISFILIMVSFSLTAFGQKIQIVTEHNPPYNFRAYEKDSPNEVLGVSTEVVRAIFDHAKMEFNIRMFPWKRAYMMAKDEENVMVYSIGRSKQRETLFQWIGPIGTVNTYLFSLKSNQIMVNTLDEAKKYSVGVLRGDAMHQFLKSHNFPKLELSNSYQSSMGMLFLDRVKLWGLPELVALDHLKKEGHNPSVLTKVFRINELSGGMYMAFGNKTSKNIVDRLRKSLQAIKDNKTYDKIISSYE